MQCLPFPNRAVRAVASHETPGANSLRPSVAVAEHALDAVNART